MGRASRLHREAVQNGTEQPFRQPEVTNARLLTCKKCGDTVGETMARDHIRKCWKYPIRDTDPIPTEVKHAS
jgi:protein-arginine kinase activator protein McsA